MTQIATVLCWLFILLLFIREIRYRTGVSPGIWIVFGWLLIIGARGFSTWFESGRVVGGIAEAYDQGNPIERNAYLFLIISGIIVLAQRAVRLNTFVACNKWLAVYYLFWLVSIVWAATSFLALKRLIKDAGYIVMVLVVLTDRNPYEAAKAVFTRCACVLVPLSVLFIRYYPELGRAYHVTGEQMNTGVATQKNSLGILAAVCGLFLLWDLKTRIPSTRRIRALIRLGPELAMTGMAVWLLFVSHSSTSLLCGVIGTVLFVALNVDKIRKKIPRIEMYALGLFALYAWLDSAFNLTEWIVVDVLNRDMTFTDRTIIWQTVLGLVENPVIGTGYGCFWSGERLTILYERFGILQAHNGYIDLYLNGGFVAIVLFAFLIWSSLQATKKDLKDGDELAVIRFVFIMITLIANFSEASFNKGGLFWMVFLLAVVRYPRMPNRVPQEQQFA